jgi:glutamine synthetase
MQGDSTLSTLSTDLSTRLPGTNEQFIPAAPASLFGQLTLSWHAIAARLGAEDAEAFRAFVTAGTRPTKHQMDAVGRVVLEWAKSLGATHFAHWFQPLTGLPAEKHDAFLRVDSARADLLPSATEELRGALLWQGEPDASSFPSGGLRATHTARGYTVWDPKTPMFIRKDNGGCTLIVPCAFISYTGHALDHKTPLLRSTTALSKAATRFVNLVMNGNITRVTATLGTEQEYFLVEAKHFARRPDLVMAGRTLLGVLPARHQQLEDHYFGVIPSRVQGFMADLEGELVRLGIPVKTRHCEVAPSQFELAPIFEEVSVACDHNLLTMETIRRVAQRHGLVALFHEKPFAGVNGSGKHNNWSLCTDTGINLLDPGDNPTQHLTFVAVLAAVLLAVQRHADVMRASVASAGNDHRLGANEAPPSIVSAYLGEAVDALARAAEGDGDLKMALGTLHRITEHLVVKLDPTDRNRTAPFAFTGNKFEYRAVGSSENCAWPMTVLNAAVADVMQELSDWLAQRLASCPDRHAVVRELVRAVLAETKAIRFEGDGYSRAWREEAARRGLRDRVDTPAALAALANPSRTAFLARQGVLGPEEVAARLAILSERYMKLIEIEAQTLAEIATCGVLPALERQVTQTHGALEAGMKQPALASTYRQARLDALLGLLEQLQARTAEVLGAVGGLHLAEDGPGHAAREILPAMKALRDACDEAETMVAADVWPMPTYREMLFPSA